MSTRNPLARGQRVLVPPMLEETKDTPRALRATRISVGVGVASTVALPCQAQHRSPRDSRQLVKLRSARSQAGNGYRLLAADDRSWSVLGCPWLTIDADDRR